MKERNIGLPDQLRPDKYIHFRTSSPRSGHASAGHLERTFQGVQRSSPRHASAKCGTESCQRAIPVSKVPANSVLSCIRSRLLSGVCLVSPPTGTKFDSTSDFPQAPPKECLCHYFSLSSAELPDGTSI